LFPIPLNEPDLFTADPAAQHYIRTDPYGLRYATARFLFQSFALDIYLRRARQAAAPLPLFLALAGQDRIIDNIATRRFLAPLAPSLTIREYPQAHHTLEFEPADCPWFTDLLHWLESVIEGDSQHTAAEHLTPNQHQHDKSQKQSQSNS
jgi:alpha-beta hydrolase superfamily lysophospholipase